MKEAQELIIIDPKEFGLEETKATEMTSGLKSIIEERNSLETIYDELIKRELNPETLKQAKSLRMQIRDNRTKGIEVWHKTNKAFYLAGGRFVDAVKNKEVLANDRMEAKLDEIENYFVNLEKDRIANLKKERTEKLSSFDIDVEFLDLGGMSDEQFEKFYNTQKLAYDAKIENERLAEEKRLEEEKRAEDERKENERLDVQERERMLKLSPYSYLINYDNLDIRNCEDKAFEDVLLNAKNLKERDDEKKEAQRLENERLQELEKQRIIKLEKNAEKHIKSLLKAGFVICNNDAYIDKQQHRYEKGNYSVSVGNLQNMTDEDVNLAISNVNTWIKEQEEANKLKAENELLKQQQEADKKRIEDEEADKLAKEKALANAGDKVKLRTFFDKYVTLTESFPVLTTKEGIAIRNRAIEAFTMIKKMLAEDGKTLL